MRLLFLVIFSFSLFLLQSCRKDDSILIEDVIFSETPYSLNLLNSTLPSPTLPSDNELTEEKFVLGRMLFYSKLLSSDESINCASCHNQANGFSDPTQFSVGVNGATGSRQSMAIFNLAWHSNGFFWDGRADLLRHQSLMPIQDPLEMNETMPGVIHKLQKVQAFKDQFFRAFGSYDITSEKISLALENFMFGIVSDDSKYDRFLAGKVSLTESEERGRVLYFGEYNPFFPESSGADCAHCHAGNNFENDLFVNNGLDTDAQFTDLGYELVTGLASDRAKFKITSLRNIAVTGPYMHDGRFQTLEEVIQHYNSGVQSSSTVDPALLGTASTGLMLDAQDIQDLVNFLNTLTDYTFLNNPQYSGPN